MVNFLLFITAYILFFPLTIWNYFIVEKKKGYFRSSALSLDIYANKEFRSLWNRYLKTGKGYSFGVTRETISSALGKNERDKTLTKKGKILVKLLNWIDEDHCKDSINNDFKNK